MSHTEGSPETSPDKPIHANKVSSINVLAPPMRQNPFPTYAALRQSGPVKVEPGGVLAVARYRDVQYVLKRPNLFSSAAFRDMMEPDWIPSNPMAHSILCLDPPEHTKRRALIGRGLTSSGISGMRAHIEQVAARVVDGLLAKEGPVDFVAEVGAALPARVIAEFIGLDHELHHKFRRLGNALASITPAPPTAEQIAAVVPCLDEMQAYMRAVVRERRARPTDDMVSRLIAAEIDGRQLTDDELMTFLFILVPAGAEAPSHFLTKAALHLARRPADLDFLHAHPERIPDYVEELLRFDPSIHGLLRLCTTDAEIGGVAVPAGSLVLALLASASRDEEVFPDPDRFDIDRNSAGHFGFGHGVHACLGAALGRLEATILLTELSRRVARIELAPDHQLSWNVSLTMHGLTELPVRCVAR